MKIEEVIRRDQKYAPSSNCTVCGQPTRTIADRCVHCLEATYLKEELSFARELLERDPEQLAEVGTDRRGMEHLVLFRSPKLAWCGAEVTQKRSKRGLAKPAKFVGTCKLCQQRGRQP